MKMKTIKTKQKNKLIIIDISSYQTNNNLDLFYKKNKDLGFYKLENHLEIPKYIPIVYDMASPKYDVSRISYSTKSMNIPFHTLYVGDYLLLCCLYSNHNTNKDIITDFVRSYPYNNFRQYRLLLATPYPALLNFIEEFAPTMLHKDLIPVNSFNELKEVLKIEKDYAIDYSLYKGVKTIPRLRLVDGCYYNCNFCIVPKPARFLKRHEILNQVRSFKDLRFKLIYIDDKTYSYIAPRVKLHEIRDLIREYNKYFKGFIVQTRCDYITSSFIESAKKDYIKYVEIGVETYNVPSLKRLNKNITLSEIKRSIDYLYAANIKVIVNIMIGIPGETIKEFKRTLRFLNSVKDKLFNINITYFSDYSADNILDTDQTALIKPMNYHIKSDILYFNDELEKLQLEIINNQ